MVLKLLYAFAGKGIGGHKQVDRACLFNEVHNQAYQVKIAKAIIMCIYFMIEQTKGGSEGFVHVGNKFGRLCGIFGKGDGLEFTGLFWGRFVYCWNICLSR